MGILLFELFRNPLFMVILNKWETLVSNNVITNISIPIYYILLFHYLPIN